MIVQEQRCGDKRERRLAPSDCSESSALWRARRTVQSAESALVTTNQFVPPNQRNKPKGDGRAGVKADPDRLTTGRIRPMH
jgi:hypothetical protein